MVLGTGSSWQCVDAELPGTGTHSPVLSQACHVGMHMGGAQAPVSFVWPPGCLASWNAGPAGPPTWPASRYSLSRPSWRT